MHPSSGLHFGVATSLEDVLDAWTLVGAVYGRAGMPVADDGIRTLPEAIGPQAIVAMGWIGQLPVSTVTGIVDGPAGLPLDRAFPAEVDLLRSAGKRLMELTLFADTRAQVSRSFAAILELMRHMYYFARHEGVTDVLIGLPPRVARYYVQYFSFDRSLALGVVRELEGEQVELLRLDLEARGHLDPPPREHRYFLENPLPKTIFSDRYMFPAVEIARSPLAGRVRPHTMG